MRFANRRHGQAALQSRPAPQRSAWTPSRCYAGRAIRSHGVQVLVAPHTKTARSHCVGSSQTHRATCHPRCSPESKIHVRYAKFGLRQIGPTAVLWSVVPFAAVDQPLGFGGLPRAKPRQCCYRWSAAARDRRRPFVRYAGAVGAPAPVAWTGGMRGPSFVMMGSGVRLKTFETMPTD
jgi:hypothetical protein